MRTQLHSEGSMAYQSERDSPLKSRPAAGKYLGVHTRTIDALIRKGKLSVVHVGRRKFVRTTELDAFIAAGGCTDVA